MPGVPKIWSWRQTHIYRTFPKASVKILLLINHRGSRSSNRCYPVFKIMNTSYYQQAKLHVMSIVDLSKDAIHVHLGMLIFFLWIVTTRKSLKSFKSILPVLVVAVLMEILDLRDDYYSFGFFRWKASIHDLVNTVLWPFVIVIFCKLGLSKNHF